VGFDDISDSPAFWILAGGGVAAEVAGYILSKSWTGVSFPIWQLIIIMAGTVMAAAYFASKD